MWRVVLLSWLWVCCRYLEYCLDPTKIRKQDATSTVVSIAGNPIGQPLAWDFVRANWDHIVNEWVFTDVHMWSFGTVTVKLGVQPHRPAAVYNQTSCSCLQNYRSLTCFCLFLSYGGFSFGGLISGVTKRFSSEFEYKQVLVVAFCFLTGSMTSLFSFSIDSLSIN